MYEKKTIRMSPGSLNGYKAEMALKVLVNRIASIKNVGHWAKEADTPESTLRRIVIDGYGKTPGEIQREVRYEKVIQILEQDIRTGAYAIALDTGFKSEDSLRMFLRRRYGTNLSKLRMEILSGTLNMDWVWLNGSD